MYYCFVLPLSFTVDVCIGDADVLGLYFSLSASILISALAANRNMSFKKLTEFIYYLLFILFAVWKVLNIRDAFCY